MFPKIKHLALVGIPFCVVAAPSLVAAASAPTGETLPFSLSVRAGSRSSNDAREFYGVVELSLPLEALPKAAAHRREPGLSEAAAGEDGGSGSVEVEETPDNSGSVDTGHDARREPGTTGVGDGESSGLRRSLPVSALLDRRLVRDCVARALRGMGRAGVAARLDSYGSRARWAAALPELRLRGGRSADSTLRLAPTSEDPYRYTQSDGADLFFEVDVKWRLDRLLYDSDELAVERLRAQYSSAQGKRIQDVLDRLADWQASAARFADLNASTRVRVEAWVRLSIAGFWLDVYTGGWFDDAVEHRIEALWEAGAVE